MSISSRRSIMTLYSSPDSPESHRVRTVLAEKDIVADIILAEDDALPEDLAEINPYNNTPTLLDRDLILYDSRVIMEYLDERFPHPPLMPVDPVSRAHSRLALFRIERDWYGLARDIVSDNEERSNTARAILRESIVSSAEVFGVKEYFLSDTFSLVDCTIAPILWRLPYYKIDLPQAEVKPIMDYMERVFSREKFVEALTGHEEMIRP